MNNAEFSELVNEQLESCKNLLVAKGREYSTEVDKLHNFKVSAELQGTTQRKALGGMMSKHTVSIYDMIQSVNDFPAAVWNEKITDHINYLLLLQAVVTEDRNLKQKPVIINSKE